MSNSGMFPKRISKVIKIKKITKSNKPQIKQSSYNNVNNENDEDDFDYMLKESINKDNFNKKCIYNIFENNKLIKQKQIDINIKNSNKNLFLFNQHIESIQLNSYNKLNVPKENHHIKRKKLNLNLLSNLDLNNPEIKNQFIHNNIANYTMLQKINFFQRLKSITEKRFLEFQKDFQKDYYFLNINQFENIFIDENDLEINSPLTLIFHHCFNPEVKQMNSCTNFFEFICKKRGDENYSMEYNKEEIKHIPKYFNNINYVNNLFNNFSEKELNLFLLGINKWKKTFTFEQKFKYTKHVFKDMTMHDVATIYFISPLDMIIDYHSYGSDIPMADIFVAISQYRFHCDINFNKKKGKFNFKTSCTVYNTIKLVKKTLLKKYVINESNKTNQKEIQRNIWPNLKKIIKKEDRNNQQICDNLFKKYLKNNLYKYSKAKPNEKIYNDFFQKNGENENIKMSITNFDSGTNFDIISNSNNEFNLFNNNINIINNIKLKEAEEEVKDIFNNYNINQIKEEKKSEIKKDEKESDEKKPKKKRWRKRRILKYGVCIIFALYVIKTIISLGRGYFSNEKKFNIFLSIIIGLILIAIQIKKRRNR
jgi:hypothetical protein